MTRAPVEGHSVDWQAGQTVIDGLREIVRRNRAAAVRELELVRDASVRVTVVQQLMRTPPAHEPIAVAYARPSASIGAAEELAAEVPDAVPDPPVRRRPPAGRQLAGVARLRDGPVGDLFRATDGRPIQR